MMTVLVFFWEGGKGGGFFWGRGVAGNTQLPHTEGDGVL